MVDLMERVGGQEDIDGPASKLGYSPYQVLIVASLIEREAAVPEDRAKIARVIYNRICPAACRCRSTHRSSTSRTRRGPSTS